MNIFGLGKRGRKNTDLKTLRALLDDCKSHVPSLGLVTDDKGIRKVLKIIDTWDQKQSLYGFYQNAGKQLNGLAFDGKYTIDITCCDNDKLSSAIQFWNCNVELLAEHFQWKTNKLGTPVGV